VETATPQGFAAEVEAEVAELLGDSEDGGEVGDSSEH
jgi:hypothetical protein